MNVTLRVPRMTREEFFPWAEAQDRRCEFDGFEPVEITGGDVDHGTIHANLPGTIGPLLRGTAPRAYGPDMGVATAGRAVRCPDALMARPGTPGRALLVNDPLVVFEVVSRASGRLDRRAVPSVLRCVVLERTSIAAAVFARAAGVQDWTATACLAGDMLDLPEAGIGLRRDDRDDGVDLAPPSEAGRA